MVRHAIAAVLIALSLLDAATARADVLFDSSGVFAVSSSMGAVVVSEDFNGDRIPDLASVARYAENAPVSVLLGRGDGTFQQTTTSLGGGLSLAAGDLNGDGNPDLVVPGFSSVATVLFGTGDGTFHPPVGVGGAYSGGALGGIMSVAIAQLGGADPGLDIAVTNTDGLQVLLGKGDGTFDEPATYPGWAASELVAGDFTEDGQEDVALTRFIATSTGSITVLPGSAAGALGTAITTPIDEPLGAPVVTDDDGDGLLDIVGADRSITSTTVTLFYGAGDGTFEFPQTADFGGPSTIGVGDFDRDAEPDIAATTYYTSLVIWLATGAFAESEYSPDLADGATDMAVIDLNGDQADDVATATYSGKVIVSLNAPGVQAAPGSLAFASQTVASAAPPQTITVTNNGTPDLRISGISVEGAAAGDFTTGGSCRGATLAAGAACSIAVGFRPGAAGARAATLVITGNQAGRSTRLPLAGAGLAPPGSGPRIVPDTKAPALTLKVSRQGLGTVLRRGLRFSMTCSEACNVEARATISSRTARRLRLSRSRKPFVVGRSRGAVAAGGSKALRLRLSPKTVRALRKQRAIVLTVVATARDAAGNTASAQQKLRLRR